MHLAASEKGISALSFNRHCEEAKPTKQSTSTEIASATLRTTPRNDVARKWIHIAETSLQRYFKGDSQAFRNIPLDIQGTPFQKKVWAALRRIPPGKTLSYAEIARRIGSPKAFRAVGTACGKNPVALIVPCHRVVGSGKSLGGYAGGIRIKKQLLKHENALHDAELAMKDFHSVVEITSHN
ncbi:MAG: methylated-DNA--[protein]-cysteine S-methyltransferase [Candidatus Omnitrophica bacterium]|nr:methylated-DNA--[protein]-cysteine S-methyltransferase [Candidatus Omnitrophota bacterium]